MILIEGSNVSKEKEELEKLNEQYFALSKKMDYIQQELFESSIIRLFFKRNRLEKELNTIYSKISEISIQIDSLKKYIRENGRRYQPGEYEGVCKDKNGVDYFVFINRIKYYYSESIEIYFTMDKYSNYRELILFLIKQDNSIFIEDFQLNPILHSLCLGSKAIKYVENIAVKENITEITGNLSDVDDLERLKKFYKKNGFEVFFSTVRNEWQIKKSINI